MGKNKEKQDHTEVKHTMKKTNPKLDNIEKGNSVIPSHHKEKKTNSKGNKKIYNFDSDKDDKYDIDLESFQDINNHLEYLDDEFNKKDEKNNTNVSKLISQKNTNSTVENSIAQNEQSEQKVTIKEKKNKESNEKKKKKKKAKEKIIKARIIENKLNEENNEILPIYSYASGSLTNKESTHIREAIAVTGNLVSPLNSKNFQVDKVTIQAYGKLLIKESEINLINGRRYGLIAPNGSGKSTLMHAIASNLIPRPQTLDVYLLDREYTPTEMTSIDALLDINKHETRCLEEELIELLDDPDKNSIRINSIEQRMAELEIGMCEHKARNILEGLGFNKEMMQQKTCNLSGGWRMRISLARILFVKPTLILLDEPTNHLDFEAIAWLEDYLVHELDGHTLLITSHSQDTLNEIYGSFTKKLNMTGSKQQQQAKSKLVALEKKIEKDKEKNKILNEDIIKEKELILKFENCNGGIPSPAIKFRDVSFGFPDKPLLFRDLNFGINLNSKIALVGPNGAGKTTLIRLLMGNLQAISGDITRHHHLRIAHFHQHMNDQLNLDISAVQWLHEISPERSESAMRGFLGKYGLTGKSQVVPMKQLSDGQRRRVLFAFLGLKNPHIIMFDEPTNALDINTIDALCMAINNFDGGAVIISHDFMLINKVATEIWVIENGKIHVWDGSIKEYKEKLKKKFQEKEKKKPNHLF
ncbi:unnamed protein product [Pneumocystis jirovecii]|uniref:ABC transporter domain-containing protein n=1 Tax=Pneumocystis jirovecii TaxID=42068 RepID=L0P6U6_PNEJI|nr:unnamed protein product [Pneumocystis jirovecii]